MPDAQEEINQLSDKLRESHNKLTETLLEIVRPAKLDGWPNPYDECFEEESEHDRSPKAMD